MNAKINRPAPSKNEQNQLMTFQFSESKQPVRNLLIEGKPWFITKDVCDVLGIKNSRDAISTLDDDEKGVAKSDTLGGKQSLSIISESGLYALILRSNKPYARTFRKWITSEVIPAIQKNGVYKVAKPSLKEDFIDLRNELFTFVKINNHNIRVIIYNGLQWFSINDIKRALNTSTGTNQLAKTLQDNVLKIWIRGNTNPAWFCDKQGVNLIGLGNRTLKKPVISVNQLNLFA